MTTKTRLIFFSILIFLSGFSQEVSFRKLDDAGVLANGTIFQVLQDRTGFLWFGTDYGLYRFDGMEFTIYRNDPAELNSLSDNTVLSILEDSKGFIWIGTANGGLNRFDPSTEKFIHWISSPAVTPEGPGLSDNNVTSIVEDQQGVLWLGTYKGGLNRFDPASETFYHWFRAAEPQFREYPGYVTSLILDRDNNLWIGCYEGLYLAKQQQGSLNFRRWSHEPDNPFSLSHNNIWSLYESPLDSNRGFWIGTYLGLDFFEVETERFIRYTPDPVIDDPFAGSLSSIAEDRSTEKRVLWLGSYGGLLRFDPADGSFRRWRYNENDPTSPSKNRIIEVYVDRSNVLWLGTNGGLNYYSRQWGKFKRYSVDPDIPNRQDINLKEVTALCTTSDGTIWLGTNHGLYYLPVKSEVEHIKKYEQSRLTEIWSICPGNSGDLWIGTYGNGFFRLEISSGKLQHWLQKAQITNGLSNNYIRSVIQDRQGFVWVGLWGWGLNRYNPRTGEWRLYQHDRNNPYSLSYNDVWDLHEDHYGNIWIGTKGGGLNLYDRRNDRFYSWGSPGYLSHNGVLSITESVTMDSAFADSSIGLWIGTENGLNYFTVDLTTVAGDSIQQVRAVSYHAKNGLPSDIIKSIIEDEQGNIWIGTNLGLAKIRNEFPVPGEAYREILRYSGQLPVQRYTVKDGLPDNDFILQAAVKSINGLFFWGSSGGVISFSPDQVSENRYIPPVVITRIAVQNEPISRNYLVEIPDKVPEQPRLRLNYKQNSISFWFSALDYTAPEECQFTYKLENFENAWAVGGNHRFASYTNLDPGNYIFRVKGSNSDGIWNEAETTFSFVITPPWWRTHWAYLGYILLITGLLYTIRRYEMHRVRLRHQLTLQTLETRKFQELEKMKSRFFTNLSHEFRTPLMLITGPVEQLRSGSYKGNLKKIYGMISRNSRRLLDLVDQSLALSQLEAGVLPLRAREENLTPFLRGLVYSFDSLAEKKGIQIVFETDHDSCPIWIDHDKFEKIITNLLSNAMKFTPAGGKVTIRIEDSQSKDGQLNAAPKEKITGSLVSTDPSYISISISDTGIGIPPEHQKKIFERFYQVDDTFPQSFSGSGIGLALVKELVDLHHWTISLHSEIGKGSTFILQIPRGRIHLKDEEIVPEAKPPALPISAQIGGLKAKNEQSQDHMQKKGTGQPEGVRQSAVQISHLPKILIVEDSIDVRYYLSTILTGTYELYEAATGEEGLKKASSLVPDLIISDIMMPAMDGMEFCRRIKSDLATSHIPVILLTARASHESRLEGLETGADDYLVKPFERRELLLRVKNLIEQRQRMRDKFKLDLLVEPSAVTATSMDEDFLKKAIAVVEKNLADPDFETENFARALYLSRSQLHRKLTGLTGQTPGEFIRTIRLKRAAQLLQKRGVNVSEVAYEVGFNNLSYFAKAFRRLFNSSPSEYLEKSK